MHCALFWGEEIQKSKSGGGENLEEFKLYLPVPEAEKVNNFETVGFVKLRILVLSMHP